VLSSEQIITHSERLSASGHWCLDLADDSLFWSPQVFRIHGLDPGAPQPDVETALAYYLAADQDRVREKFDYLRRTGEYVDFVARLRRHDGEVRYVRSIGEYVVRERDHPGYLLGVFRDITEEWVDARHQRRVALALEETAEAIIMTDPDGLITWCNSALIRVSGYSLSELQGRKPGQMLQGPDTDPDTVALMRDRLARDEPFVVEILNYGRDGGSYWVRLSVHADRDEHEGLLGYTGIQIDITESKRIRLNLEREIERRIELESQLRHLASHDALSDMPNRRHFFEQAARELGRCQRYGRPLSLVLFDLDAFKGLNDSLGHAAGDTVIRSIGALCRQTLREQDFAARIGGEEFTILLPETGIDGAYALAERLRQRLAATPIAIDGSSVHVTASFGVSEARPEDDTVDSLLARVDRALYAAKEAGRDRVRRMPAGANSND